MKQIVGILVVLLSLVQSVSAESGDQVKVEISVQTDWLSLSETSAVRVRRALSPHTVKPIEPLPSYPTLKREFILPSQRLTLGEPLLVEYRVSDSQESIWQEPIGGRYRGSGRDDNFEFFLVHEDGTWVSDPYGKTFDMGGLSTRKKVGPKDVFSYWHPVQRWCALDRPGNYKFYCLRWASDHRILGRTAAINESLPEGFRFNPSLGLVDSETGQPPTGIELQCPIRESHRANSPIKIPQSLLEEMERRDIPPDSPVAFAQFEIVVEAGAPSLNAWQSLAQEEVKTWPDNRATAARMGLWYLPQIAQLSVLREWIEKPEYNELNGLAMNPHRLAIELLLEAPADLVLSSLYRLRKEHRGMVKPWLEKQAGSADSSLAERSAAILKGWEKS